MKNKNSKKYYYFDKLTKSWNYLGNINQLKKYLEIGVFFNKNENKYDNFFIKNESYDFSDESYGRFVFFDDDFNIVDVSHYKKEIIKSFKSYDVSGKYYYLYRYKNKHDNHLKYGDLIEQRSWKGNIYYKFRIDPVPNLRKYYSYKIKGPKYKRIISTYLNPEKTKFIRIHHYGSLIADMYDYEFHNYRCIQKSWKEKKIKHQWEKNLK